MLEYLGIYYVVILVATTSNGLLKAKAMIVAKVRQLYF